MLDKQKLYRLARTVRNQESLIVLSAIRGPDLDFNPDATIEQRSCLKHVTTAVVRSLLGIDSSFVTVVSPEAAMRYWDDWSEEARESVHQVRHTHFMDHIIDALETIGTEEAIAYRGWLLENVLWLSP